VGIVNRRNAALGWATWKVAKRVGKSKAKGAVPAVEEGRPNKSALALVLAGVAGALAFWRSKSSSEE
jgi:hypothetical protein